LRVQVILSWETLLSLHGSNLSSTPDTFPRRSFKSRAKNDLRVSPSRFTATFFLLFSMLMPSQVNFYVWGDTGKLTPGRIAILVLLVPALSQFMRRVRRSTTADFFAAVCAAWMVFSRFAEDGLQPSAVAEAQEFFGGYLVARGLYCSRSALEGFYRALKIIVVALVVLSIMDPLFHTNIIFHVQTPQERFGLIRATAVFDGAEMNGAFFAAVAPIFLYSERNLIGRSGWTGLSLFGCLLAISSGPMLSFVIVLVAFCFDNLMGRFQWRWKALTTAFTFGIAFLFGVAEKPVSWIVTHLTLDPASGYFRMYVFDYMFELIRLNPIVGIGFGPTLASGDSDNFFAGVSVDCTWIVYALRFGIPMICFLLLTMLASFLRFRSRQDPSRIDVELNRLGTGYTLAIVSFALTGLTVHIFHSNWVLWGILTGIRASIKEIAGGGDTRVSHEASVRRTGNPSSSSSAFTRDAR
jgi:hypothetical protein